MHYRDFKSRKCLDTVNLEKRQAKLLTFQASMPLEVKLSLVKKNNIVELLLDEIFNLELSYFLS